MVVAALDDDDELPPRVFARFAGGAKNELSLDWVDMVWADEKNKAQNCQ